MTSLICKKPLADLRSTEVESDRQLRDRRPAVGAAVASERTPPLATTAGTALRRLEMVCMSVSALV